MYNFVELFECVDIVALLFDTFHRVYGFIVFCIIVPTIVLVMICLKASLVTQFYR